MAMELPPETIDVMWSEAVQMMAIEKKKREQAAKLLWEKIGAKASELDASVERKP